MWNVSNGAELIDPETRTVRPGVTRRYTPGLYSDAAFDDAIRQEASIRMGGGNATTNYYLSLGYLDDQGYALNSSYERTTLRMNVKSQLRDWVKVGANIGYGYSRSKNNGQTNGSENVFEFADKMAPIFPVFLRDNDGNFVADPIFGGNQYDYGYGAEWCIWCHVFKDHIKGNYGKFSYKLEGQQGYDLDEKPSAAEIELAHELNAFVSKNFIIANIEAQHSFDGYDVLFETGGAKHIKDSIPFIYTVDENGIFLHDMPSTHELNALEKKRNGDDWYRGYNRDVLLQELKKLLN